MEGDDVGGRNLIKLGKIVRTPRKVKRGPNRTTKYFHTFQNLERTDGSWGEDTLCLKVLLEVVRNVCCVKVKMLIMVVGSD